LTDGVFVCVVLFNAFLKAGLKLVLYTVVKCVLESTTDRVGVFYFTGASAGTGAGTGTGADSGGGGGGGDGGGGGGGGGDGGDPCAARGCDKSRTPTCCGPGEKDKVDGARSLQASVGINAAMVVVLSAALSVIGCVHG